MKLIGYARKRRAVMLSRKGTPTLPQLLFFRKLRHYISMQTIDVPQSASLYRYIEKKDTRVGDRLPKGLGVVPPGPTQ